MFDDYLDKLVTKADTDVLISDLDTSLYSSIDLEKKRQLREWLANLSVLELVVAFEPALDNLKSWVEWGRANLDKELVLKVRVDESVLGGAEVVFAGKYKDVTLRSRLDSILRKIYD